MSKLPKYRNNYVRQCQGRLSTFNSPLAGRPRQERIPVHLRGRAVSRIVRRHCQTRARRPVGHRGGRTRPPSQIGRKGSRATVEAAHGSRQSKRQGHRCTSRSHKRPAASDHRVGQTLGSSRSGPSGRPAASDHRVGQTLGCPASAKCGANCGARKDVQKYIISFNGLQKRWRRRRDSNPR